MPAAVLQAPFDLDSVPDRPAVFLAFAADGPPYLARTALLRRRLKRLLARRESPSRVLNLSGVVKRVEYHLTASRLSSAILYYELARRWYPNDYARRIRLRSVPWVKVLLANEFPRTQVTSRLSGSDALFYGPFRTRASAERFEQEVLDMFQVRRCQEDLVPSVEHPGCIYGEMARCLRPCQEAVGREEYRTEVERLTHFLESGGRSLIESAAAARERFSEELNFEEAQRQHQRIQRIEQVLKLRDDLVEDARRLGGVAALPCTEAGCVELRFMIKGVWCAAVEFSVAPKSGEVVPLDRRLRELTASLARPKATIRERAEHVAVLARWFYSSWRDADWIPFARVEDVPYRKLVRAISKVAAGSQTTLF